ncbi:MAG: bifunctional hydroxymethylpyrimidine kinase/phosphomethylpyrimidine kinase [Candidatus Omnitrophica bacterium]|nr:bifunctional hydroxymethylpyrimidine kinase/phosphomethylpyrimidine kinase [Candidatus Omnitrophota bacterium]
MSLLVVGSIALDSVKTPFGERDEILGGSATYFSISASFFTKVSLVAVVGTDFPKKHIELFKKRGLDLDGLEFEKGKTFRWKGNYAYDLNNPNTIYTKLNVFKDFYPAVPVEYKKIPYLFLANIDPHLQLLVLKKVYSPRLVACDSMNFWIQNELKALKRLLKKIGLFVLNDSEAKLISGESNLIKAAKYIFSLGPKRIIIKRGDSGAIFFTDSNKFFCAPAYLIQGIKDPTGAGDTFAGGLMGYLSKSNDLSESGFRKAIIYGTIMASFCVQDFGPNKLLKLKLFDIKRRFTEYKRVTSF